MDVGSRTIGRSEDPSGRSMARELRVSTKPSRASWRVAISLSSRSIVLLVFFDDRLFPDSKSEESWRLLR